MGTSKSYRGGPTGEGYGQTNPPTQSRTRTTAQGTVASGEAEGEKRQQNKGGKSGGADRATYGGSRAKPKKGYGM